MIARYFVLFALIVVLAPVVVSQSGTWEFRHPMLHPRSDHTANVLQFPNGPRVVLFGGCTSENYCLNQAFCSCNLFTNKTTAYDPATDSWTELPEAPLPRFRHASAVVKSKLYIIGGRDLSDNIITEVHVFDPSTLTWSSSVPWNSATSDLTTLVKNDTIYAIGGYNAGYDVLNTTWIFAPEDPNPQWTSNQVADMLVGRGDACAVMLNGNGYVLGGWSSDFCTPRRDVEAYSFSSNTWSVFGLMPTMGGDKSCSAMGGKIHIFGGEQKSSDCSQSIPLDTVETYDAASNSWSSRSPMLVPRFRFAAVTWTTSSGAEQVIIFGGQGAYNTTSSSHPVLDVVSVFTDTDSKISSSAAVQLSVLTTLFCVVLALIM